MSRVWRAGRQGGTPWRRVLLTAALVLVLCAAAAGSSWATWEVVASRPGNTFFTKAVLMYDNQGDEGGTSMRSGAAMFDVTGIEPGSPATTRCIGVDLRGNAGARSMTLTATLGGSGAAFLGDRLTMQAAERNRSGTVAAVPGENTNGGSCAGYPASGPDKPIGTQGATLSQWAAGGPYPVPARTGTWYRFTISGLPPGTLRCPAECGQTVTVQLSWTLTTG